MILPILLIAALLYWVAAPDPVTAGARTASGTAARAAGTGARAHWAAGRRGRQARRTQRRDRWWQAGGLRRAALRGEHAAVWTCGAAKTTAGLAAAAARPVPAAAKVGWSGGLERHRNRAGSRRVVLDPPWWRREQPQVQPGEQGAEQPRVRPWEQVEERCPWTVTPHALSLFGVQRACGRPVTDGVFCAEHAAQARVTPCVTCGVMLGPDHTCRPMEQPAEQVQVQPREQVGNGTEEQPLDTEEQIRARRTPAWNRLFPEPLTEAQRRFWTERDGGYTGPLDQDGRPGDPSQWPFKPAPDPAETTTSQPSAATQGGSMPVPTELRNHIAVQDFAQQVDNLSESSDFIVAAEKARTVGENSRTGGFGQEMDLAVDSLEEMARRFAQSVDDFRAAAHRLAKTSVSVRGS